MLGAFTEMGPFVFRDGETELSFNNDTWTKVANMLFIESPCAVGWSYCNSVNSADDNTTATDNLYAVRSFFDKYPQYKENDFYVAGESYAGVYVPYLAYAIHNYNLDVNTTYDRKINMVGWIVGNAVTNWDYDCDMANIDWLYEHAMYPIYQREQVLQECAGSGTDTQKHECKCPPFLTDLFCSKCTLLNNMALHNFCLFVFKEGYMTGL